MGGKIVWFEKTFEQMKKVYEAGGYTVMETEQGKAEVFDESCIKKHELILSPKQAE